MFNRKRHRRLMFGHLACNDMQRIGERERWVSSRRFGTFHALNSLEPCGFGGLLFASSLSRNDSAVCNLKP